MSSEVINRTADVPDTLSGARLDQILAELFPDYSRARFQKWIKDGQVTVEGLPARAKDRLWGGEHIVIAAVQDVETTWQAEEIPLNIVYEDEAIIVLNKPAGLVVHPGAGNREGTLGNALLHYAPELERVPRAGVVHRLDKDTSGLLVVARTLVAQTALVEQLQERAFERLYEAVTQGVMTAGGTVDAPVGRHASNRLKMTVTSSGKEAVTHYRVIERFSAHTHVRCQLETGRTHQIRVHMAHIHFPLVGDPVYGGRLRLPKQCTQQLSDILRAFKRQALHAALLGLRHPLSGEHLQWQAPLPEDMMQLLAALRQDARSQT